MPQPSHTTLRQKPKTRVPRRCHIVLERGRFSGRHLERHPAKKPPGKPERAACVKPPSQLPSMAGDGPGGADRSGADGRQTEARAPAEEIARVNTAVLRAVTKKPRRKNGMRVEPFSQAQQVLRRSERFGTRPWRPPRSGCTSPTAGRRARDVRIHAGPYGHQGGRSREH